MPSFVAGVRALGLTPHIAQKVTAAPSTCDLKKLTTAQDVLGTRPLVTGHYTELRLVVLSATLYFDNASTGAACATTITTPSGRSATVTIPSGDLRLNRARISDWVVVLYPRRISRRALIFAGSDKRNPARKGDTLWVRKKPSPFSSPSTAF